MFYKSSLQLTIVKKTSKLGIIYLEKIELLSKFFKSDSPIKKVLIDVLLDSHSQILVAQYDFSKHHEYQKLYLC